MAKDRTRTKPGTPALVEEDRFLQAILASPDDTGTRLVYADWLEERGDPRGEFLRLEAALMQLPREDERWEGMAARLRELRGTLDRDWLTALGREPVEMCELPFAFQCPKQWERLRLTADVAVRFCESCQQNVHYCHTIEEAKRHAWLGRCVVVDPSVPREEGDLVNGMRAILGGMPHTQPPPEQRRPFRVRMGKYRPRRRE